MTTTMPWGETVEVLMELGFPVNKFTLNSPTLGLLNGIGRLDGTLLGDDISAFCEQVSVSRGRTNQLTQTSAGTATITLNNNTRRFDPINELSPYWNPTTSQSGVTPRRKVTISVDGIPLFVGRISDIDLEYQPQNPSASTDLSTVKIMAVDDFVLLANTFTSGVITPTEELSGTRVSAILDLAEVGYPATRSISAGVATLGGGAPYEISANTNVLTYLQNIAESESGNFYIAADGDLTFTDRIIPQFAGTTPIFSDTGTDIPYTSLGVAYGQELLYNKVQVTTADGTVQTSDNVASQTEFGISTYSLNSVLLSTDAQALTLSSYLLEKYGIPVYRFDAVGVGYNRLTSPQRTTVSTIDLGTVISITRTYQIGTPSSVTKFFSIEAVDHSITNSQHQVLLTLAVAKLVYPFTLDNPVFGLLDSNNALQ